MSIAKTKFDFTRIDRRTRKVTPALIAAIRDRIVTHLHPEKIILFGSRANNTAMPESDVDLLVILGDHHPLARVKRRDRFGALLNLFRYRSFGLDAIVLTGAEVQKIKDENEGEWDLILEILAHGVTLYERASKTKAKEFEELREDCQILTIYKTDFAYLRPIPEAISVEEAKAAIDKARPCTRTNSDKESKKMLTA